MSSPSLSDFQQLAAALEGSLHFDATTRKLYATDASVYREMPQAVALPKTEEDIRKLVAFARNHHTSLIPRTAGTSLAGQVVGAGIVVDVSRHFNRIIEIDAKRGRVRVQPAQPRACSPRHFLRSGDLNAKPLHDRRHGRKQRLWCKFRRIRQHARALDIGASGVERWLGRRIWAAVRERVRSQVLRRYP